MLPSSPKTPARRVHAPRLSRPPRRWCWS